MTRRFAQFLLIGILGTFTFLPLTTSGQAQVPDVATTEFKLENGLKVILRQDRSVPRVNVIVAYHVGSKNERPGRTGFAHFFEHMMFRGTRHVPNYDKPLQEAGSSSNAFTSEDVTVYFETVPSNFLERAIYLEADRLAWLPTALDQNKFDTEREVVKNERRQSYENVPYGLAEETILASLYPAGHPYRWSVIGSMSDLSKATLEDLKQFFAEFYHPANATVCLVGDFDTDHAKALIEKYFSSIQAGPKPKSITPPIVVAKKTNVELVDQVSVPRIYWVWPAVNENADDAPALEMLGLILSSGDASRLHERLVINDQSATSVRLGFNGSELDGFLQMTATVAPGRSVEELEKSVSEELEKLRSQGPDPRELERMKAQYELAAFSPLEDPQSLGFALAMGAAQYGDSKQFRKDIQRVLAVTPKQVHEAAQKYLVPDKLRVIVRPAKPGEEKTPAVTGVGPLATAQTEPTFEFRTPSESSVKWQLMPGPTSRPAYDPPVFTKRTLKNGTELWHSRRDTPLVHLQFEFQQGTLNDPAGLEGLATLTGLMMDKGTATKTNRELTEAFELLGSSPGISIGPDQSSISLTLLPRNLKPALTLITEIITQPRLAQEELDRQKSLMQASLKRGPDSPAYLAGRAFNKMLYGSQSRFGHPSDGFMHSIEKIRRENVLAFFQSLTRPEGTRAFVVGNMTTDEAAELIESVMTKWETAPSTQLNSEVKRPAELTSAQSGTVYLVDKPGAVQSVIRLGRRWKSRLDNSTYLPGQVGNYTLGGDFLSRLNQNLRERNGYSYGAGSGFGYIRGGDRWQVSTSVRADVTGDALREIFNELDGLTAKGTMPLTDQDLDLARDALIQSFPEGFGTPNGVLSAMQALAEYELDRSEWTSFMERVGSVSNQTTRSVMAELVDPTRLVVVIAGDRKTVEPQLIKAGFKTVVVIPVSELTDAVKSETKTGTPK
jgi:zinc protease